MSKRTTTSPDQLFLLEALYKENLPGLTFYARRFVPEDVAGDIVQDLFLRLWQGGRTFLDIPDGRSQRTYLYRAVRNACRDWLKHQVAVSNHADEALYLLKLDELQDQDDQSPEEFEQRLQRIGEEVERLPERCREIFCMHYRQQKKSAEIAQYFGISQRTVEAQLYKALQLLRKTLK